MLQTDGVTMSRVAVDLSQSELCQILKTELCINALVKHATIILTAVLLKNIVPSTASC